MRAFIVVLIGGLLLLGGYLEATNLLADPAGQNITEKALSILFWPLVIIQVFARIGAIGVTAGTISEEKRRQTWDNLRATQSGAELAMRARWAAAFYRLRGILGLILLLRVALIAGILYDLTAFQGRYLDLLINGPEPSVPLVGGALLLAFTMTAALLLPLSGIGVDAAVGLFVSTVVEQRVFNLLTQIFIIALRIALVGALVYAAREFIGGDLNMGDRAALALLLASAAMGEWALAFLNLSLYGEIWATVPYTIFAGIVLLLFVMLQAVMADIILKLAVRRAERAG